MIVVFLFCFYKYVVSYESRKDEFNNSCNDEKPNVDTTGSRVRNMEGENCDRTANSDVTKFVYKFLRYIVVNKSNKM